MKGKLGRINGPWFFPFPCEFFLLLLLLLLRRRVLCHLHPADLPGLWSGGAQCNAGNKCHLTRPASWGCECPQFAFDHISIFWSKWILGDNPQQSVLLKSCLRVREIAPADGRHGTSRRCLIQPQYVCQGYIFIYLCACHAVIIFKIIVAQK